MKAYCLDQEMKKERTGALKGTSHVDGSCYDGKKASGQLELERVRLCLPGGKMVLDFRNVKSDDKDEPPQMLFKHQIEGIIWMFWLHIIERGGILGDDMGMGKTKQVCAFLKGLFTASSISRVLITGPILLLSQWGSELSRMKLSFYRLMSAKAKDVEEAKRFPIVLISYGFLEHHVKIFKDFDFDKVIVDEAHLIKNPRTLRYRNLKSITAKKGAFILLSGTVIQNNLEELWSLMSICHGDLLGKCTSFKANFSNVIKAGNSSNASQKTLEQGRKAAKLLKKMIDPYYLRRYKSLLGHLPPKHELVIWLELSQSQKIAYIDYLEWRTTSIMRKMRPVSKKLNVSKKDGLECPLSSMQDLQMACSHPDLCKKKPNILVERKFLGNEASSSSALGSPSAIEVPVKFVFLRDLLHELINDDHAVLIFSPSVKLLTLVEIELLNGVYQYFRIDGETKCAKRETYVKDFQKGKFPIFLLSSGVGSLGLTLTRATRVIILEPSWNPSCDNQAVDRAYRLGQTKEVYVYRLICNGTIEEYVYKNQVTKSTLMTSVLYDHDPLAFFDPEDESTIFQASKDGFKRCEIKKIVDKQLTKSCQQKLDDSVLQYMQHLEGKEYICGVSYHNHIVTAHRDDYIWSSGKKTTLNSGKKKKEDKRVPLRKPSPPSLEAIKREKQSRRDK